MNRLRTLTMTLCVFLLFSATIRDSEARVREQPNSTDFSNSLSDTHPGPCESLDPCTWDKTVGGKRTDKVLAVTAMPDGGFAFAGVTSRDLQARPDAWVFRTDETGRVVWSRVIGQRYTDEVTSIALTSDGDIVVAGHTRSSGNGESDIWVVRLSSIGIVVWQSTFGGSANDRAHSVIAGPNGSVVVAGFTRSRNIGDTDAWVIGIDAWGAKLWEYVANGPADTVAVAVTKLTDGGFAVTGRREGQSLIPGGKTPNIWVSTLNADGSLRWQRQFERGVFATGTAVLAAAGGDLVVAGVMQLHAGATDKVVLMRFAHDGRKVWEKDFGGGGHDSPCCLASAGGDGFVLAVGTSSHGEGSSDAWLQRYRADGSVAWERIFGGKKWDRPHGLVTLRDGGLLMGGVTTSRGSGYEDGWVVRLDKDARLRRINR